MSTSDKISLNIDPKGRRPSLYNYMLESVHLPAFPLVMLRLREDKKIQDYAFDIRVGSKLYELLNESFANNDLILYTVLVNGSVGVWNFDLLSAFKILSHLNILESTESWVKDARASMSNYLAKVKVESKKKDSKSLTISKEFLTALELVEKVNGSEILGRITKEIVSARKMDPTTIIYRLGMVLYHAKDVAGESPIEALDDPSSLYLKLSQSTFFKKHSDVFAQLADLEVQGRNMVTKALISLVIAAYAYQREVN